MDVNSQELWQQFRWLRSNNLKSHLVQQPIKLHSTPAHAHAPATVAAAGVVAPHIPEKETPNIQPAYD